MLLTQQDIDDAKSINGGWSREQLALIDVQWPPQRGWRKIAITRDFDPDRIAKFKALKNAHRIREKRHALPKNEPSTDVNERAAYLTRILTSTCQCGCGHAIGERRQQNLKRHA